MAKLFTKDTIVDEVLTEDARYNILEDGGTAFKSDMQIVLATPVATPGTSIDADILNNLEDGVDAIDTRLDNLNTVVVDATDLLTTGGSSTAYTLTTTGAENLATGERFRVKFHATAGATPTLNRDAKGAKALKYYDSAGTKTACASTNIVANMISDVVYDGTDYVVLDPVGVFTTDATLSTSDITTNNASTLKHGFLKKLSGNSYDFMNGIGDWIKLPALDGWIAAGVTWTYAGPSTFTISGDYTSVYKPSTLLKFTQTTPKYATVVSSSYSAPNTTVTIAVNTDYTIANAAITSPYYSYTNALDHPLLYNFSPNWTNLTVGNGTLIAKFSLEGSWTCGHINLVYGSTTSISGAVSFATPVAAGTYGGAYSSVGNVSLIDTGVALYMGAAVLRIATQVIEVRVINAASTYAAWNAISATVPFTWAVTTNPDELDINFRYHI